MINLTNSKTVDASNTDWNCSAGYVAVLEEDEDGGFLATIPTLPGCITQGDTEQEALDRLGDALGGWITVAEKRGLHIPPPF